MDVYFFSTTIDPKVIDSITHKYNSKPINGFNSLQVSGQLSNSALAAFIETLNSTRISSGEFSQALTLLSTQFEQNYIHSNCSQLLTEIEEYALKKKSTQWYYDFSHANTLILLTPKN
jgi:hypothetical protein